MSWNGAASLVAAGSEPWQGDGQVKFTSDVRCARFVIHVLCIHFRVQVRVVCCTSVVDHHVSVRPDVLSVSIIFALVQYIARF